MTRAHKVSQPRAVASPVGVGRGVISYGCGEYMGGFISNRLVGKAVRQDGCPGAGVLERDMHLTIEDDSISGRVERKLWLLAYGVEEAREVADAQAEWPIDGVFRHHSRDISLTALKIECVTQNGEDLPTT